MFFKNLSGFKAVCQSVQQLKIVQIAVILLVFVQTIEASTVFGIEQFNIPAAPRTKSAETAAAGNSFGFDQFNAQSTTTTKAAWTIFPTKAATTEAPKVGSSFGFGLFHIPSTLTNKAAEAVNSLGFGLFNVQTTTTTKAPKFGNSFGFGQFNAQSTTTTKVASTVFPTRVASTKDTFTTKETITTKGTSTPKAAFPTLTTKSSGGGDYCSMCKSHVACKKNNVRSHLIQSVFFFI